MDTPMPEAVKKIVVHNVNEVEEVAKTVDFVFSAVAVSYTHLDVYKRQAYWWRVNDMCNVYWDYNRRCLCDTDAGTKEAE